MSKGEKYELGYLLIFKQGTSKGERRDGEAKKVKEEGLEAKL